MPHLFLTIVPLAGLSQRSTWVASMQQLEKRLGQLQQQHTAEAAQVETLRQQLATAQQHQAASEQLLQGQLRAKAAALGASEKKLRHLEAVLRRVADKADKHGGSGSPMLIPVREQQDHSYPFTQHAKTQFAT